MRLAHALGVDLGRAGARVDHAALALRAVELGQRDVGARPRLQAVERLAAWTGLSAELPELNGAQRQRRMLDAGASPAEVYAQCVRETEQTYVEA